MPVLIHLGGGDEAGSFFLRKESRRPPWSYWADQTREKDTRAEMKEGRGPETGVPDGGDAVGAGGPGQLV